MHVKSHVTSHVTTVLRLDTRQLFVATCVRFIFTSFLSPFLISLSSLSFLSGAAAADPRQSARQSGVRGEELPCAGAGAADTPPLARRSAGRVC